ncbi:MAG TPA: nucleotidyltransferase domain-containing protein [Chloroflexota bacterium]|nr:nucleotidyltransferase domain-containing protein [Chloroflexota bacterium]
MDKLELRWSTGDQQVDAILRGVVGVFEAAYPGRVRAYYLTGSFADGTAVATSDLDLQLVFEGALGAAEEGTARRLFQACAQMSPVGIDAVAVDEARLADFASPDLMLGGRLVYGTDIRDRLTLVPIALWARALLHELPRFVGRMRGEPPPRLVVPLGYPDPHGPYFGYDGRVLTTRDGRRHRTTKDLVRAAGQAASGLAAWRAGRYVRSKRECAASYREAMAAGAGAGHGVGDKGGWEDWAGFLEELDRTCRAELGYLLPQAPEAKSRVRALCARAPGFENHAFAWYRELLLEDLTRPPQAVRAVPRWVAAIVLGLTPEAVEARLRAGTLPAAADDRPEGREWPDGPGGGEGQDGRRLPAGAPVLQAWAARMLSRVVYPGDQELYDALSAAAGSEVEDVRRVAQESLAVLRPATSG